MKTCSVVNDDHDSMPNFLPFFVRPGKPGCRNVRAGGDSVPNDPISDEASYMTYIVWRSFKFKPQ